MYYVVRKDKPITEYHASFYAEAPARAYAENLKASFGRDYDVIKVVTTWTTQTLETAIAGKE